MEAFAQWLAGTPLSQGIARTLWLIPVLQSIHILGIAVVLSSVAMIECIRRRLVLSGDMWEF